MKIALFRILVSDSCSYESIYDEEHAKYTDGVRISGWIEVEFPARAPEEFVPEQVALLDKAEAELRGKFEQKLHQIAEQRAKLRCLTHQPAEEAEDPEPGDPDGECFRGNEWAAAQARESDWIQRNLK